MIDAASIARSERKYWQSNVADNGFEYEAICLNSWLMGAEVLENSAAFGKKETKEANNAKMKSVLMKCLLVGYLMM